MQNQDPEVAHGAIESPPDYRSDIASATFQVYSAPSALPSFEYANMARYPVLMQALEPACVSNWLALAMQDYWFRKTGNIINFSPRFLDALMKTYDGLGMNDGAYPIVALKAAVKYGCATTDDCPNDTSLPVAEYRDPAVLTPQARQNALQWRIPGFIKVSTDIDSIRAHIAAFGVVGTLKNIGSEWWNPSWKDADIDPIRTPAEIVGGHMTSDFGWSGFYNKLRNSWSDQWADRGNARYDFAAWSHFIREAWVIAEIPDDVRSLLATLPAPQDFHYRWDADMAFGGAPSDDVKFAQIFLMIQGYMAPPPADQLGVFGPKTAAAVLSFQQANGVPTSGLGGTRIGPLTRAAMNAKAV